MIHKTLISLFLLLAVVSCKKDDPAINVLIEGIVLNAETTQPVVDAKVQIITKDATYTASSNESGYFNLGTFTIGDYTIIISKEGYATQTQQIYAAGNLSGGGEYGYDVVKSVMCNLVPANGEAELTIYRQYEGGEVIAAGNFPYVISTGDMNAAIEGTTDENGRISLNSVPQVFTVTIDHEVNDVRYYTSTQIDITETNYIVVQGYYAEANLGMAACNLLDDDGVPVPDFPVDGTISVTFTVPVDTLESTIQLLEDNWQAVDISYNWSENNTKVVIAPGNDLNTNTLYALDLSLEDTNNSQAYDNSIEFYTAE